MEPACPLLVAALIVGNRVVVSTVPSGYLEALGGGQERPGQGRWRNALPVQAESSSDSEVPSRDQSLDPRFGTRVATL